MFTKFVMDLKEFAEAVEVSEESVRRLIAAGVPIPHIDQKGKLLFRLEEAKPVIEQYRAMAMKLMPLVDEGEPFKTAEQPETAKTAPEADAQKAAPKKRGRKPKTQGAE